MTKKRVKELVLEEDPHKGLVHSQATAPVSYPLPQILDKSS